MLTKRKAKQLLPQHLKHYRWRMEQIAKIRKRTPDDPHLPENVEAARRKKIREAATLLEELDTIEKEST